MFVDAPFSSVRCKAASLLFANATRTVVLFSQVQLYLFLAIRSCMKVMSEWVALFVVTVMLIQMGTNASYNDAVLCHLANVRSKVWSFAPLSRGRRHAYS